MSGAGRSTFLDLDAISTYEELLKSIPQIQEAYNDVSGSKLCMEGWSPFFASSIIQTFIACSFFLSQTYREVYTNGVVRNMMKTPSVSCHNTSDTPDHTVTEPGA